MYRAKKEMFSENWVVEIELQTIVGVPAWFTVCVCEQSYNAMEMSDGHNGNAKETAEKICDALNKVNQK